MFKNHADIGYIQFRYYTHTHAMSRAQFVTNHELLSTNETASASLPCRLRPQKTKSSLFLSHQSTGAPGPCSRHRRRLGRLIAAICAAHLPNGSRAAATDLLVPLGAGPPSKSMHVASERARRHRLRPWRRLAGRRRCRRRLTAATWRADAKLPSSASTRRPFGDRRPGNAVTDGGRRTQAAVDAPSIIKAHGHPSADRYGVGAFDTGVVGGSPCLCKAERFLD